jgi:hypothetical protein
MEHIATSNIMSHADRHHFPNPLQLGFRKGLSCETHLVDFIDDITRNIDEWKQTDCLIMDFSKAFDKMSYSLLVMKLSHYGTQGKTNKWIENFLNNRKQAVVTRVC